MDMIEITTDEEGRLVGPKGLRLRLPSHFVVEEGAENPQESEEERAERHRKFWEETDAILDATPVKPWPEGDPIVEKYRRKGLIR